MIGKITTFPHIRQVKKKRTPSKQEFSYNFLAERVGIEQISQSLINTTLLSYNFYFVSGLVYGLKRPLFKSLFKE
jgi:hypothetical protein